jgi:hypothetical protein
MSPWFSDHDQSVSRELGVPNCMLCFRDGRVRVFELVPATVSIVQEQVHPGWILIVEHVP